MFRVDEMVQVLKTKNADLTALEKIRSKVGDQEPGYCYQCIKCTSGCPISQELDGFNPHVFVAMAKMGFIDELINDKTIWACVWCMKCKERCPMDVSPMEVIRSLTQIAFEKGIEPAAAGLKVQFANILKTGYARDFTWVDGERIDVDDLPEIPKPPLAKIKAMLKKTALAKWIEKEEEE